MVSAVDNWTTNKYYKHIIVELEIVVLSRYIDDAQLVVNLQKQDPELKWPDIMESWESLTTEVIQLLKGTSIFFVGESTEINYKIAQELAAGLGYGPLFCFGLKSGGLEINSLIT